MKKLLAVMLLALAAIAAAAQKTYTPDDIPNVNEADRYQFVSDPASLVSPEAKARVNSLLYALRDSTTAEVAVAIVPELGDLPIEDWGEQLFTKWGIGKKDRDNGVLLIISPGSRRARVQTGYGTEGVLTDAYCSQLIRNVIAPAMKRGDLDSALLGATAELTRKMCDPDAAAELRSARPDVDGVPQKDLSIDSGIFHTFVFIVCGICFLVCCYIFFRDLFGSGRRRASRYDRARMWRADLRPLLILGILSAGSGLILLLIAFCIYRRLRTKPVRCPECGAKMKRLPEDKDNELLSDSQDLEERLCTVDYDVWECPKCGAVEKFRYKYPQDKYSECPACHTIAYCQVGDYVRLQPTGQREGRGERVYECKYCHHQNRVPYVIPKKADPSAALAAAAVIGSTMGRGRGGGGSFGGGFGGGGTGGGGASGGW